MSLDPKIKICTSDKCDKINIYEETGIYNPNNLTGWGSPNINTDEIIESKVNIFDYTGNILIDTIPLKNNKKDVYSSVVGSPTPGRFLAEKYHKIDWEDGVYQIQYVVESGYSCVSYNYHDETFYTKDKFENDIISRLYYKDCEGNGGMFVFDSFPYDFNFCSQKGLNEFEVFTIDNSDDFKGDVTKFNESVTESVEVCENKITGIYQSQTYFLNLCNVNNCLNSLKERIINECDSKKVKDLKVKIDKLGIIIYGIKSSFSCKDFETVNSLIKSAKIICDNICCDKC